MNQLFSSSSKQYQDLKRQAYVDVMEVGGGVVNETLNIDKFFHDVENVKDDMMAVEKLYKSIQESNEERKMVQNAKQMKMLRSKMDSDFIHLLNIVKIIKGKLESFDKATVEQRKIPGCGPCGPGSSFDGTRTSVIGLSKKLKFMMEDFQGLLAQINDEYKETIRRRYFTITGEKANDELIDNMTSSGNGEEFLQKAINDKGREQTIRTFSEIHIQERHDAIIEIKKNLTDLYQIFLDMVMLVETQERQLNTKSHEAHASSFVQLKTNQIVEAKKLRRMWRQCACITVIIILIVAIMLVICFVVIPIILVKN